MIDMHIKFDFNSLTVTLNDENFLNRLVSLIYEMK